MPFDSWASNLEGQIADLEEYIQWVGGVLNNQLALDFEWQIKANETGQKLLRELRRDLDRKQWELDQHRRRNKESGIKY